MRFVISEPCFTVSFDFALISEVFLGVDIYLCGNVGIAVEINFLFIGLSV